MKIHQANLFRLQLMIRIKIKMRNGIRNVLLQRLSFVMQANRILISLLDQKYFMVQPPQLIHTRYHNKEATQLLMMHKKEWRDLSSLEKVIYHLE